MRTFAVKANAHFGEVGHHHRCQSGCVEAALDREVAARRAVCRASRPPGT